MTAPQRPGDVRVGDLRAGDGPGRDLGAGDVRVGDGPGRDDRRRRKRQALLQVAVSVVRRDGPDASMQRIATEAGVAKPILYRVFGDRAGLQRAVGAQAFEALAGELSSAMAGGDPASPRSMVGRAIDAAIGFVEREPALTALLPVAGAPARDGGSVLPTDAALPVVAILGEALRGLGGDSGAAEPWAYAVIGMVVWAGGWWVGRPTMPRAALVGYLTDLVCGGVSG